MPEIIDLAEKHETGDSSVIVVTPETLNTAIAHFRDPEKIDPLLEEIETTVRDFVPDTSTAKGRAAIASLAHSVARIKTWLDEKGKELNSEARRSIDEVDAQRRRIRARLDDLKAEARKPLTDWNEAEEARVNCIRQRIGWIEDTNTPHEVEPLRRRLEELKASTDFDYMEFAEEADAALDQAIAITERALAAAEERQKEREELERLRKAEAEREALEAARKAEEERKAALHAAKLEAERRAKAEAERRQKAAEEAAEAARREEREKIEAEKREAAQKAAREAEEARKRAEDQKHRAEVIRKAEGAIARQITLFPGLSEETVASQVVDAIVSGFIPGVAIEF